MKRQELTDTMRERGYIPLAEAARELAIDHSYAWKLLQAGVLSGERQGAWWFVTKDSMERHKQRLPTPGPGKYEVTLSQSTVAYRTMTVFASSPEAAVDRARLLLHGVDSPADGEDPAEWSDSKAEPPKAVLCKEAR